MHWECDCGYEIEADPTAGDDFRGEPVPVGPECPECGTLMQIATEPEPPS
jgi:hypothetical protein